MSTQLRGLILAARPAEDELAVMADSAAPQVLPVANRPLIAYSLETMQRCDVKDVAVVTSPATASDVRAAVAALTADGPLAGLDVSLIAASEPPSLPDAILAAADFLDGREVLVQLGDGFVLPPPDSTTVGAPRGQFDSTLLVRRVSGPQRRDVAALEGTRRLRLVTEPAVPPADQALAGVFRFGQGVCDVAAGLDANGDRPQISDLLLELIARGGSFDLRPVRDSWKYSGEVDELLEANRMVLDEIESSIEEVDLSTARIEGRVAIHSTAVLERTTVRGPAVIGPHAVLLDTFVGPYTAIGENVRVEGAELAYSIVLPNASIRHPGSRLEASLVGQGASISRDFTLPAALKLRVGSRAEISLS